MSMGAGLLFFVSVSKGILLPDFVSVWVNLRSVVAHMAFCLKEKHCNLWRDVGFTDWPLVAAFAGRGTNILTRVPHISFNLPSVISGVAIYWNTPQSPWLTAGRGGAVNFGLITSKHIAVNWKQLFLLSPLKCCLDSVTSDTLPSTTLSLIPCLRTSTGRTFNDNQFLVGQCFFGGGPEYETLFFSSKVTLVSLHRHTLGTLMTKCAQCTHKKKINGWMDEAKSQTWSTAAL